MTDRVILLHSIPGHEAGEHGHIHGSHHHWVGVIFDTVPGMIRYVEPIDLAPEVPVSDEAVESTLTHAERVLSSIALRQITDDTDTPCNAEPDCPNAAVWWWECACGQPKLGCEPHRVTWDQFHQESHDAGYAVVCNRCATPRPAPPLPWRAL